MKYEVCILCTMSSAGAKLFEDGALALPIRPRQEIFPARIGTELQTVRPPFHAVWPHLSHGVLCVATSRLPPRHTHTHTSASVLPSLSLSLSPSSLGLFFRWQFPLLHHHLLALPAHLLSPFLQASPPHAAFHVPADVRLALRTWPANPHPPRKRPTSTCM